MPIKIIGGGIVFLSGLLWGLCKSHRLLKREQSLKNIISALYMLEGEIVFASNKLKTAFYRISDLTPCKELFSVAAKNMENLSSYEAWKKAIDETAAAMCLTEKDAETVKLLGAELGLSDKEQQQKNIRHISTLLGVAANEAYDEYISSAKMYRSIGIFGGLFIAILLM